MTEVDWSRLFACELDLGEPEVETVKKCKCGNVSCNRAKKIRCVCQCHAVHHGEEQRKGMPELDKLLGLDEPDTEFPVEPPSPEELTIW
jgi:hypothetical protein